MKVLSLFSGVGGFDMGLENAGMQTVFQCEWDKHAITILNKHWPHVPKWDDVSTLTGKHILSKAPVIDVVAWGSPCQDLSVAGKRGGLEGERSGLFHEGIRIIKELRKETNGQYPRISIWENVVGALNSNRGADFGIILDEMAEAGAMVIEWAVLDAQYFGVPQRRRRVFVIAIFDPAIAQRCPSPLLPVSESLPGHLAKSKPKRQSATSKTATSIGTDGAILENNAPILIDRAAFNQGENALYQPHISDDPISPSLIAQGPHAIATYQPMLAFDTQFGSNANVTENIAPTLKSSQAPPSVAYDPEPTVFQPGTMIRLNGGIWEGTVPTLRAESKRGDNEPHIQIHNAEPTMAVRRLTPLECERLMGWPDHHTRYKADGTEQTDGHRYKQCGNGVASPVAQWIAKHLLKLEEQQ
jgi:DNA (cytosine-5)-methyltransferase 1